MRQVRLLGVAGALPATARSSAEVEEILSRSGGGYTPRRGLIEAMSGIRERRVAADDVQCSVLAVEACQRVLNKANVALAEVDLLIFAAAGQDLTEPATAHIVQTKVGTSYPVFDVKNACNSFLNGVQLAESLILGGTCHTVLVAVGEVNSRGIAWDPANPEEFKCNLPGYTMGDAGAAALFTPADHETFFQQLSS